MRLVNEQPRPRCLVQGTFERTTLEGLAEVFPTIRYVSSLSEVRQEEWDILVTADGLESVADHLFVVAVGDVSLDRSDAEPRDSLVRQRHYRWGRQARPITVATEFAIPPAADGYARLIESDLLPIVLKEPDHSCIVAWHHSEGLSGFASGEVTRVKGIEPLLLTADGVVLAGWFERVGAKSQCLSLPSGAAIVPWVRAAIAEWHRVAPDRFPALPDWTEDPAWQTPDEVEAAAALRAVDEEELRRSEEARQRHLSAMERISQAQAMADNGPRRLLTGSGQLLVEAARAVLADLGFSVQDMDAVWPEGDFREDLRVTDVSRPGWIAIVEVKGYSRSRWKVEDIIKLTGRFAPRYLADEGKMPESQWYVVNQAFRDDPSTRKPLFDNSPGDLAAFSEVGGLAVDTAELFRAWRAVRSDQCPAQLVRDALAKSSGRFVFGAPAQG